MQIALALLASLTVLASPGVPMGPEVAQVDQLFQAVARAREDQDIRQLLELSLARSVTAAADEAGVPKQSPASMEDLRELVADTVAGRLVQVPEAHSLERYAALEDLARQVTGAELARDLLSRWLGFLQPPAPLSPRDGPPAHVRDGFVRSRGGTGAFELHGTAQLVETVGGRADVAGWLETGQWTLLSLPLRNTTTQAWFSTSAFLERTSECVWVDGREPVTLDEFEPERTGHLALWVFIASVCAPGDTPGFRVVLRDSRTAGREVAQFSVALNPLRVPSPRVTQHRLDVDELGFSDGDVAQEVFAGARFEYSADMAVDLPSARRLRVRYSVPADLQSAFSVLHARKSTVSDPSEDGTFRAADDLDAELAAEEPLRGALLQAGASRRWVDRTRGQLWVALDAEVEVSLPPPPPPPALVAPPEEKMSRLSRGRAKAPITPAAPRVSLTGDFVATLVGRYLSIRPREVESSVSKVVAAVSGYELAFDAKAFSEAYELLARPSPPAAPPPEPPAPVFRYVSRLYRAVPLLAPAPKGSPVAAAAAEAPAPKEPAREPEHAALKPAKWFRLELTGVYSPTFVSNPSTQPTFWGTSGPFLNLLGLRARALAGTDWVGSFGLAASRGWTESAGVLQGYLADYSAEAGFGRVVPANAHLDFVLLASLGLSYRQVDPTPPALPFQHPYVYVDAAVSLRFPKESFLQVVMDAGLKLTAGTTRLSTNESLIAPVVPHADVGLSLAF